MNQRKRCDRARRRAKSNNLERNQKVPFTRSAVKPHWFMFLRRQAARKGLGLPFNRDCGLWHLEDAPPVQ
jgi:hypothetical protein